MREKRENNTEITITELCDLYLKEGCRGKKPSTLVVDRGRIKRHIKPLLGRFGVKQVTRSDVEKFRCDVTNGKSKADVKTGPRGRAIVKGGEGTAARTLGLLGAIFTFGIERSLRVDNPVHGIKRRKDAQRSRFLAPEELKQLGDALEQGKGYCNPNSIAAIKLLILTGCRKSEVQKLKWQYVDWHNQCFRLPDSKTGPKIVHLGQPAMELLRSLPRLRDNPHVFAGKKEGSHYANLQKDWEYIRELAGLSDVRIHDLRRSFASVAALKGQSLLMIGKLLGHRDPKTTQIYAHLLERAVAEAASSTSIAIQAALVGQN